MFHVMMGFCCCNCITAILWTIAYYSREEQLENWNKFGLSPYFIVYAITFIVVLFYVSADLLEYGSRK